MIGDRIRSKTLCDIVSHLAIEFIRYQGHVYSFLSICLSVYVYHFVIVTIILSLFHSQLVGAIVCVVD